MPKAKKAPRGNVARDSFARAMKDAEERGRREMRVEVLTWLHDKYLDPGVTRTSPEGLALLKLAGDLADRLGGLESEMDEVSRK